MAGPSRSRSARASRSCLRIGSAPSRSCPRIGRAPCRSRSALPPSYRLWAKTVRRLQNAGRPVGPGWFVPGLPTLGDMCFAEISPFQTAQGPHELTRARKLITQVETRSNSKTVANPVRDELPMLEWAGVLAKRSNNPAGITMSALGARNERPKGSTQRTQRARRRTKNSSAVPHSHSETAWNQPGPNGARGCNRGAVRVPTFATAGNGTVQGDGRWAEVRMSASSIEASFPQPIYLPNLPPTFLWFFGGLGRFEFRFL